MNLYKKEVQILSFDLSNILFCSLNDDFNGIYKIHILKWVDPDGLSGFFFCLILGTFFLIQFDSSSDKCVAGYVKIQFYNACFKAKHYKPISSLSNTSNFF